MQCFLRQESRFFFILFICISKLKLSNQFTFFILLAGKKNGFESDFGSRILVCFYKAIKNENNMCILYFFLPWRNDPPSRPPKWVGAFSLSRLHDHTQTHHSLLDPPPVRVISPTQWPVPDNTQHSRQTSMPPGVIRTHNPRKRAAAVPHLRSRGHRVRRNGLCIS